MAVSRTLVELRTLADETGVEYLAESVATGEGCERIIAQTHSRLGPIDVLVNNAGVLSAAERAVWARILRCGTRSSPPICMGPSSSSGVRPGIMVGRRSGRIVIVSSNAGEFGVAAQPAYAPRAADCSG